MHEPTFCPLLKDDCRKQECMLYDENLVSHLGKRGSCAFLSIAKELKQLTQALDSSQKIM